MARASLRSPELLGCMEIDKPFVSLAVVSDDLARIYVLRFGFVGAKDIVCLVLWLLTNEMQAASSRIRTSKSSNCSITSSQRDFPVRGWMRFSEANPINICISICSQLDHGSFGPLYEGPKSSLLFNITANHMVNWDIKVVTYL